MIIFTYIFVFIAIIILIPCLLLLAECLGATIISRSSVESDLNNSPEKIAVLIPAHNESEVIEETLRSIQPQLKAKDFLVVVADNCTDNTAQIVQNQGVKVLERCDSERRGKGYALAYGIEFLKTINPDVVIFMDADCEITQGEIANLAAKAMSQNKPIQAKYLMQYPPNPSSKDLISGFAFLVKNWVRPLGLANLNLPCLLTGTGIALPWELINKVSFASGNLVEDMQLGIDLAIAGYAPQFCPLVEVTGKLPQNKANATQQRTRWEHGHLNTVISQVPQLLKASWQQKRFDLLLLAGEVAIPPLSLLVLVWLVFYLGIILGTIFNLINVLPFIMVTISGLSLFFAIIASWFKFARDILPFYILLKVLMYLLWKIPIYLKFLLNPQKQWIKTSRDIK
jgi:cellulose synthase/poly-beta-1,6-N-acetylglucosamine synthase-like glycosyltransferase